ncbi:hypothetical protein BJ970_002908 [Saccharopolyspora phatthalungensis]|uniref:Uncharacterized protein n=1 Tax=Saccharopolyspora phatthalungensis TaxID=664693 RepID=A0A840Q4A5_9PSEU|nr:hypothetical protein [Saccharopolyspora phatthalungensis]
MPLFEKHSDANHLGMLLASSTGTNRGTHVTVLTFGAPVLALCDDNAFSGAYMKNIYQLVALGA